MTKRNYRAERNAAADYADKKMNALPFNLRQLDWLACWAVVRDAYLSGMRRKS